MPHKVAFVYSWQPLADELRNSNVGILPSLIKTNLYAKTVTGAEKNNFYLLPVRYFT